MKKLLLALIMLQLLLAGDIKELYVGDIINDDIQSMQKKYFKVKVEPGKILTVNITNLSNDVDLYLKTELKDKKLPTFHRYNCRSVNKGKSKESCSYLIKQGRKGDNSAQIVNILVYGFEFTSYVLEIKEKNEPYACKQRYKPVCAKVDIECFKAPCKPKYQTFSNICMMKHNQNATFVHNGKCKKAPQLSHSPCKKIYKPVCGEVTNPCFVAPCEIKKQTFYNLCMLKRNKNATLLHKGKCKTDKPTHRPKPCNKVYRPVCAKIAVDCIKSPCKPKYQTFSNLCLMGNNPKAKFVRNGRCEVEQVPHRPKPCTKIYKPVCASVKLNCITAPCQSVKRTFSNLCVMENNPNATFAHKGKCK